MSFSFLRYKTRFQYFYLPKVHRLFYSGKPNLLVNSMQKAGTHMLVNALGKSLPLKYSERGTYDHAFSRTWPGEKATRNTTPAVVQDFMLQNAWPGEVVRGHVEYDATLAQALCENEIPVVTLIRHPEAVFLSLANWWERHRENPTQVFLTYKKISNPEERLRFLMTGQYDGVQVWPDFVQRCAAFLGWIDDANCLLLRYEDLLERPEVCAEELTQFLPVSLNEKRFQVALKNRSNRTYTRPEEKIFTSLPPAVRQTFNELGGQALITKMGYSAS